MKISNLKEKLLFTAAYIGILLILWRLGMPCLLEHFFSIPCPGCGMSRAVKAILRLRFADATAYHPMVWSMPVLYLYFLADGGVFKLRWLNVAVLSAIALGFLLNWVKMLM